MRSQTPVVLTMEMTMIVKAMAHAVAEAVEVVGAQLFHWSLHLTQLTMW
jgi:hypothetical protein